MRERYIDMWKGLAILAVLVIHASGDAGKFDPWSANWTFGVVLRQIVNFAVPVFLGLAGYFAATSINSAPRYYAKRFSRILPAYVLWTIIFIAASRPGHFLSPAALAKDFFLGEGIAIGYFVVVLIQYILLTPLLLKIRSDSLHILLIALGYVASCVFAYVVRVGGYDGTFSVFPYYAVPFFAWGPFYHLGLYVSLRKKRLAGGLHSTYPVGALCIGLVVASIAESLYWADAGSYGFATSQIKASSFAASIALLLYILKNSSREPNGIL